MKYSFIVALLLSSSSALRMYDGPSQAPPANTTVPATTTTKAQALATSITIIPTTNLATQDEDDEKDKKVEPEPIKENFSEKEKDAATKEESTEPKKMISQRSPMVQPRETATVKEQVVRQIRQAPREALKVRSPMMPLREKATVADQVRQVIPERQRIVGGDSSSYTPQKVYKAIEEPQVVHRVREERPQKIRRAPREALKVRKAIKPLREKRQVIRHIRQAPREALKVRSPMVPLREKATVAPQKIYRVRDEQIRQAAPREIRQVRRPIKQLREKVVLKTKPNRVLKTKPTLNINTNGQGIPADILRQMEKLQRKANKRQIEKLVDDYSESSEERINLLKDLIDEQEEDAGEESVDADDDDDGTGPKQVAPGTLAQSGWYFY